MNQQLWLAVDAGGTSTRSLVVTAAGDCLGYAKAGSGNPVSAGLDLALASVTASAQAALRQAGAEPGAIVTTTIAMAGGTTAQAARQALGSIGLGGRVELVSDGHAGFCSGTWSQSGYVLIAGTGAVAQRIEDGVGTGVADGLGWLLGDDGSGYWIGQRVAIAALADLDGRGLKTSLTDLVLAELGLDRAGFPDEPTGRPGVLAEAMTRLYADRPVCLSRFAPCAFAASGDAVAEAIVTEAAQGLFRSLQAVMRPDLAGPVVLAGGVFDHQVVMAEKLTLLLRQAGSQAELALAGDGIVGAAVLALRAAGLTVDQAVFDRLQGTLGTLR